MSVCSDLSIYTFESKRVTDGQRRTSRDLNLHRLFDLRNSDSKRLPARVKGISQKPCRKMQSQVSLLQPASDNTDRLTLRHAHIPHTSMLFPLLLWLHTSAWPVYFLWLITVAPVADVSEFNSLCCSTGVWNTKALEINYWGVFTPRSGRGDRDGLTSSSMCSVTQPLVFSHCTHYTINQLTVKNILQRDRISHSDL